MKIHHRVGKGRLALLAGALLWSSLSQAADKLVLQTTWYGLCCTNLPIKPYSAI